MAFMGKIAYLIFFPGSLFILVAGLAARGLLGGLSLAVTRGPSRGPANGLPALYGLFTVESVKSGGSLHLIYWLSPALKLFCLSWASCIIFGFMGGDLVLLFALLVTSNVGDLLLCFTSANPRVRRNALPESLSFLAWAVPLALVMSAVALRTGTGSISALVNWQVVNGVLLGSSAGGPLAIAGSAFTFLSAMVSALLIMRFRPLGRGYFSEAPHGSAMELSGVPLAILRMAEAAALIVAPILIVSLFFGALAATWYQVLFWALKIVGILILLGVVDLVSARTQSEVVLARSMLVSTAFALVGMILVWIGVAA